MNEELKLETVLVEDCEKIRDIMVIIFEDEKAKWFRNGGKPFIPGYNSVAMHKYLTWDKKYYKVIYNNDIVGVTLISYTGREHARIDRLYILPDYQGLSIGSKVLKLIEGLFPKVNEWSLDTIQQSPRNHHFYEKNGYELIDEDDDERYYYKTKNKNIETEDNYWCNKDLRNYNFRQCNMEGTDLYDSNMSNARFSNMNLRENIISNCNLVNNRFTNVNLSNSIFADSNLCKIEIGHVSLSGAYLHDLNLDTEECNIVMQRCELSNSKIIDSNLQNVIIENCNIDGMTINGVKVKEMLEYYNKNCN